MSVGSRREDPLIVALFDSDGTLFSNQQGRGMLKYLEAHGRGLAARMYWGALAPAYFLTRLKLIPTERFQQYFTVRLGSLVKGMDPAEAGAMFEWVANDYLLPTKRPETEQRLKDHRARGHAVVIVSAMFVPCLALIGTHFGVTDLIGTELEMRDGRCTGSIVPPLISGPAKAERVRQLLAARADRIDWSASFAYGDSFTDRDMLGLVGHPVAVYPDAKLNALALEKKWEVLGTPK
jgi:HAD superfamily hydrolase (TIGR01490 family)